MSNRYEYFSYRALEREVGNLFLNLPMPGASNAGIISPVAATGQITWSAGSAETDVITINGVAVTIAGTGTAATDAALATAAINSSAAAAFVTASTSTVYTNLTANLTATQNGYQGNNVTTVITTGSNPAFGAATLTGGLSGLLPLPENKGILAAYQLTTAGYYMVVLQDTYKAMMSKSWEYLVNSATPPATDAVWSIVDNVGSRSTVHILFGSFANTNTIVIGANTFTGTTAAQASSTTFAVGANSLAAATNFCTMLNGVNPTTGASSGYAVPDPTLSAILIPITSTTAAVLVGSTQGGSPYSTSSLINVSTTGSHATLTPSSTMAAGPGIVWAFFGAGGSTPTDPAVGTTVKAHFKLRIQ